MEEIYRGHRISVRVAADIAHGYEAKIWTVRGHRTSLGAQSSHDEGPDRCFARARQVVDEFLAYRDNHRSD